MKLSRGPPSLLRPEGDQLAAPVALDELHRMDEQADIEAAFDQLADDRIDKKRHVVVDDFEHRLGRASSRPARSATFGTPACRSAERPRLLRDGGKFFRGVALQIFGHREAEKLGEEILRDVGLALCERRRAASKSATLA